MYHMIKHPSNPCPCGGKYQHRYRKKHFKTRRHFEYISKPKLPAILEECSYDNIYNGDNTDYENFNPMCSFV